ncbi:MAG TPA: 50S ribosomal protein L4 [Candidatus Saccharimonadales bacterium]
MSVAAYTKTGSKSTAKVALDKAIFGVEVTDTELIKQSYAASKSNARTNVAHTKTRGEVRGGGRKPWRQKGTGRARFGSIRNPIWRGGGIVFGPRTKDNYTKKPTVRARRQSLRQALSLASSSGRLSVIESMPNIDKTKDLKKILDKIGFEQGLIVAEKADSPIKRFSANLPDITFTTASKLSVGDVLDSASLLIEKPAIAVITDRLKG